MSTLAETWIEQGSLMQTRRTLRRRLTNAVGLIPGAIDARIETADQTTLDDGLDRTLGAPSLGAVFGSP